MAINKTIFREKNKEYKRKTKTHLKILKKIHP